MSCVTLTEHTIDNMRYAKSVPVMFPRVSECHFTSDTINTIKLDTLIKEKFTTQLKSQLFSSQRIALNADVQRTHVNELQGLQRRYSLILMALQ